MAEGMQSNRRQLLMEGIQAELVAARSLYLDGFVAQAALHLVNGWYALACLQALEQGEEPPQGATFAISPASLPNSGRLANQADLWEESFAAVRAFAPTLDHETWIQRQSALVDMPRARRRRFMALLRFQLKIAEDAYQKLFWQQKRAHMGHTLGNWRRLAAVAAVMVILLGGAAGFWLTRDAGEAVAASVGKGGGSGSLVVGVPAPISRVKLADISEPIAAGTAFNARTVRHFGRSLVVDLGGVSKASRLEVSLDNNDTYKLVFLRGNKKLAAVEVAPKPKAEGLRVEKLEVPAAAVSAGYDAVMISVISGDIFHVIGHMVLSR